MTEADTAVPVIRTSSEDEHCMENSSHTAGSVAPPTVEDEQRKERNSISREDRVHDVSYHPGVRVTFFSPPFQRQQWGDTQVLPRTNWGDLFFDLFYVAAAYNVANIIVDSPTSTGFLYFCGTFFPVMNLWMQRLFYDSRYAVGDDLFHRFFEAAVLLVLATAILHIRSVDIMSTPQDHVEMFAFALSLVLGSSLMLTRYVETYFWGVGQLKVIRASSVRDMRAIFCCLIFYLSAAIYAGLEFYRRNGEKEYKDAAVENFTNDYHRTVAEASASYFSDASTTNVPIYLCLFGAVSSFLYLCITVVFCFPAGGRHKEITIPMNIDFSIHRNGEWIMLMLGESVLSLLIVDTSDGTDYYLTFYSGVLTIVLSQYLHFRSQPHHAEDHAMRRNKNAGVAWNFMNQVYSAALICLGASFKLFLYEFTYESRRLELMLQHGVSPFDMSPRWLAGSGASAFDPEERQQRSANVYCASLSTIWFCADAMLILHSGLQKMESKCRCSITHKVNMKGAILVILRICLLAFIATLSQWETDPEHVALIGLGGVCCQLILRVIGNVIFPIEQIHDSDNGKQHKKSDPEEHKWPNITHAVAEKSEDFDP